MELETTITSDQIHPLNIKKREPYKTFKKTNPETQKTNPDTPFNFYKFLTSYQPTTFY